MLINNKNATFVQIKDKHIFYINKCYFNDLGVDQVVVLQMPEDWNTVGYRLLWRLLHDETGMDVIFVIFVVMATVYYVCLFFFYVPVH